MTIKRKYAATVANGPDKVKALSVRDKRSYHQVLDNSGLADAFVLEECTEAYSCWGMVEKNSEEYEKSQSFIMTVIFAAYYKGIRIRD